MLCEHSISSTCLCYSIRIKSSAPSPNQTEASLSSHFESVNSSRLELVCRRHLMLISHRRMLGLHVGVFLAMNRDFNTLPV